MVDITRIGIALCIFLALATIPGLRQSVSMLNVGQGDSLLLQDGTIQVLVDGGPGSTVLQRLSEQMPWFDRRIEVLVATHPHRDHIEGLLHVLDRYQVGMVLLPQYAYESDTEKQFLDMIIQKHIPYRFAWYGQHITAGSMHLRVMAPIPLENGELFSGSTPHDADVIVRLDVDRPGAPLSMILTGDAEEKVERQLLYRIPASAFRANILKIGHHGSITSTGEDFLQAVSPSVSLISLGEGNSYGHPRQETLDKLKNTDIFRTDKNGTITFTFLNSAWHMNCTLGSGLAFFKDVCINK